MFILGVTGGIGSGKSTAAAIFRRLVTVIDADEVARCVVEPKTQALESIADHFGHNALLPDGTLNRSWLRYTIFSNPDEKKWLESLLHPIIRQRIVEDLKKSESPYAVLVSPLLLETDQRLIVNRILVIDVPENIQIARVTQRDNSTADAVEAIMNTQLSRTKRLKSADDIIINTSDVGSLEKSIYQLNKLYLSICAS